MTTALDTIAPSELPSLPLEGRRDLPDTAAIYFVLAGDTVLYVGQSVNVRQRWAAHHRLAQLNRRGGCRIAWITVDDAGLLDELERACVAHFEPILNDTRDGSNRFTIIFSVEAGQRLRTLARQMELPVSVMLRLWALDRIGDEERRVRGRDE